jgi:hypothetical protein
MKATWTVRSAEAFGRTRLSQSFFMRDFLYSEIASINRMVNLPDDPELAIAAVMRCASLASPQGGGRHAGASGTNTANRQGGS